MLQTVVFDRQPDAVGDVVLQPAFADVEHFVEHARNVEPQRVHVVELRPAFHFRFGEPFFVGESKFQFVAVESRVPCPFDGEQFADFDLADARQVIDHLLLFVPELCFVGEMLPFASSAHPEVLAKRDSPFRRV